MDPSVGLQAASGLVNFLLKTTLEWLVCLLLVRIAGSARGRFNLWLTMLLAFVGQWIWMCGQVARVALRSSAHAGLAAVAAPSEAAKRIAVAAPTAGTLSLAMAVLLVLYATILLWRLMGTLAARTRLARAMRFRSAPGERLEATFQEVVDQAETHGCELWILPGLSSPATLGWLRPRVIVPPACETQDEAELKAVFWHELKHVERRDALWNALVRACRNLLWFHPAVHHATAALNAQRELACDAAVVREHPQSRDVYASCLVRFARMRDLAPEPAIPTIEMASGAGLLTLRVRSILSEGPAISRFSRTLRGALNMLLVGLMAATVPGLNILFAAEQSSAMLKLPVAADSATGSQVGTKRRSGRAANGGLESAGSLPIASGAGQANSVGLPHDEALAAEHRAAMGILTESTGMDTPSANDGRTAATRGGNPGRGVGAAPTSWGTVAMDAAAKMGPLMGGDHDGGDHK